MPRKEGAQTNNKESKQRCANSKCSREKPENGWVIKGGKRYCSVGCSNVHPDDPPISISIDL